MQVGSRQIGGGNPCFVVAEAGLAHEGRIDLARRLVDLAVDGGADAVKFQIYRTEELISRERDLRRYEIFKHKELPYEVFRGLKEYAESRGIIWFATPHTLSALAFLGSLDVPIYKIGSGEKGDDRILRMAVETGKPVFISTGMRTEEEIWDLILTFGWENMAFLHCVTMYPVSEIRANLGFIRRLRNMVSFRDIPSVVGYSDHFPGILGVKIAVSAGTKIIEKHIKLPESTGQDISCALNGIEFKEMVQEIRWIEKMLGSEMREYSVEEKENEKWALKGKDGLRPLY